MKARPLWRCPKCGKYYVTRNVWHACARHTVEEHFQRRDPKLRYLFDALVAIVRRNGPLRVVPGKTRIAFQQRMRFGGVMVRRNSLDAAFTLRKRLDHPRIQKLIAYSPHAVAHHVEIRTPDDLDDELAGWFRDAYRVGQQLDLFVGKKAPPRTPGEFAWSDPLFPRPARTSHPDEPARPTRRLKKQPRPMWRCPKCGFRFPTRNQMHICSKITVAEFLKGKSPAARRLFEKLATLVQSFGPAQVMPQKTRVAFRARKGFLSVRFLRDAIECELTMPRRVEHPRFRQILSVSPHSHYHSLRVSSPVEMDRDVRAWLREAYRSAC